MKETRLYTLFEKTKDGGWKQMFDWGLKKSQAVRVFQNALLAPFMSGGSIPERKLGLLKKPH